MTLPVINDFLEKGKWKCTACGACCKMGKIAIYSPDWCLPNGHCIHLQDDNKCGIYDERPWFCNSRRAFEYGFDDRQMAEGCRQVLDLHMKEHPEDYSTENISVSDALTGSPSSRPDSE